ncbi:hypothetical protein ACIOG8_31085 [Streptomyces erythrochromogenes]|uniref:nSTAND1 domain-containing NTPase n=1 Tax=Streptomyces erythrochromogenes TaxID=285574 RepID=UPI003816C8FA
MSAFQPEDADRFFGREHLIAELLAKARDHRFLTVPGPRHEPEPQRRQGPALDLQQGQPPADLALTTVEAAPSPAAAP